ncbi:MAG: Holliday junction ATP-dependent DNA helicase RuvA [Actinomycetota bacterium]|nr:Holliday junction ATP-dependent DNA helicase RuvA [Actinomycetota bacterium]
MIGSLRGVLVDRCGRGEHAVELLVEAGGVGYRVVAPTRAYAGSPALGAAIFVHVHTHLREDALTLYGFPTRDERDCFEQLIGARGVGPAGAVTMLSVHSPSALRRAVAADDADALVAVPGIGPKSAARLLPELRARLDLDAGVDMEVVGPGAVPSALGDLRAALAGLGYSVEEIRQVLAGLPEEGRVEDLLRLALRDLAAAR